MEYRPSDRIAGLLGENPLDLVAQVAEAARLSGEARARFHKLEDMRKVILAEEARSASVRMQSEKANGATVRITDATIADAARASYTYKEFLTERERAEREWTHREAEMYALRNRLDVLMEMLRYLRQEMRLTGEVA